MEAAAVPCSPASGLPARSTPQNITQHRFPTEEGGRFSTDCNPKSSKLPRWVLKTPLTLGIPVTRLTFVPSACSLLRALAAQHQKCPLAHFKAGILLASHPPAAFPGPCLRLCLGTACPCPLSLRFGRAGPMTPSWPPRDPRPFAGC